MKFFRFKVKLEAKLVEKDEPRMKGEVQRSTGSMSVPLVFVTVSLMDSSIGFVTGRFLAKSISLTGNTKCDQVIRNI